MAGTGLNAGTSTTDWVATGMQSTSLAASLTNGDFLTFTLDPKSSFTLDLSDTTVRLDPSTFISGGANRTNNAALFTSVTGFTAGNVLASFGPTANGSVPLVFSLLNVNALASISIPVEIRVYLWNSGGTPTATTGWTFDGDNSTNPAGNGFASVTGVLNRVPVPEPSSVALLIPPLALLLVRRRRTQMSGRFRGH